MALAMCMMPTLLHAEGSGTETEAILVLSDTDMVPTVYETGQLGPLETQQTDTLSIVTLPD